MNPSSMYKMCNDLVMQIATNSLVSTTKPLADSNVDINDDFISDDILPQGSVNTISSFGDSDDFMDDISQEIIVAKHDESFHEQSSIQSTNSVAISSTVDIPAVSIDVITENVDIITTSIEDDFWNYFNKELLCPCATILETWNTYFPNNTCSSEDEALCCFINMQYGVCITQEAYRQYKESIDCTFLVDLYDFGRVLTINDLNSLASAGVFSQKDGVDITFCSNLLHVISKYAITDDDTQYIVDEYVKGSFDERNLESVLRNNVNVSDYFKLERAGILHSQEDISDKQSLFDISDDVIELSRFNISSEIIQVIQNRDDFPICKNLLIQLAKAKKLPNIVWFETFSNCPKLTHLLNAVLNDTFNDKFARMYFLNDDTPEYMYDCFVKGFLNYDVMNNVKFDFYLGRAAYAITCMHMAIKPFIDKVTDERYFIATAHLVDAVCTSQIIESEFRQFLCVLFYKNVSSIVCDWLNSDNVLDGFNSFFINSMSDGKLNVSRNVGRLLSIYCANKQLISTTLDFLFDNKEMLSEITQSGEFSFKELQEGQGLVVVHKDFCGDIRLKRNCCFGKTSLEIWVMQNDRTYLEYFKDVDFVSRTNILNLMHMLSKSNMHIHNSVAKLCSCAQEIYSKYDYVLGFIYCKCQKLLPILTSANGIELLDRLRFIPYCESISKIIFLLLYGVGKQFAKEKFECTLNHVHEIVSDSDDIILYVPNWNVEEKRVTLDALFNNWTQIEDEMKYCAHTSLFVKNNSIFLKIW